MRGTPLQDLTVVIWAPIPTGAPPTFKNLKKNIKNKKEKEYIYKQSKK